MLTNKIQLAKQARAKAKKAYDDQVTAVMQAQKENRQAFLADLKSLKEKPDSYGKSYEINKLRSSLQIDYGRLYNDIKDQDLKNLIDQQDQECESLGKLIKSLTERKEKILAALISADYFNGPVAHTIDFKGVHRSLNCEAETC